jgi:hypothetical protein
LASWLSFFGRISHDTFQGNVTTPQSPEFVVHIKSPAEKEKIYISNKLCPKEEKKKKVPFRSIAFGHTAAPPLRICH